MSLLENWRMLLEYAGVGVPSLLSSSSDVALPRPFDALPAELRINIYTHLIDGEPNPVCHVWSSHLYVELRRSPALASLLLTCKAFYLDAASVPFVAQTFDVLFGHHAFAYLPRFDNGIVLDEQSGFRVLSSPLRIRVTPRLNSATDMIAPLLRLQRVVRARQDRARRTDVDLSMAKVDAGKKLAVLRSLRKFLEGLRCEVVVTEIEDIRAAMDDTDECQWLQDLRRAPSHSAPSIGHDDEDMAKEMMVRLHF